MTGNQPRRRVELAVILVALAALVVGWRIDAELHLTQPTLFWCFLTFGLAGCVLGWLARARSDRVAARRWIAAAVSLGVWRLAYFPLMVIGGWLASIGEWLVVAAGGASVVYPTFLLMIFALNFVIAWIATAALTLPESLGPVRRGSRLARLLREPPRKLLWLVGAGALPVAAMVSFSNPSDLALFKDRPWREERPIPEIHAPERNAYGVIMQEHDLSVPAKVLALNAYITYPLVPEGPWGGAMKGTLEALALENPIATSQQRIDEHYLAYLAAHRRLQP